MESQLSVLDRDPGGHATRGTAETAVMLPAPVNSGELAPLLLPRIDRLPTTRQDPAPRHSTSGLGRDSTASWPGSCGGTPFASRCPDA